MWLFKRKLPLFIILGVVYDTTCALQTRTLNQGRYCLCFEKTKIHIVLDDTRKTGIFMNKI